MSAVYVVSWVYSPYSEVFGFYHPDTSVVRVYRKLAEAKRDPLLREHLKHAQAPAPKWERARDPHGEVLDIWQLTQDQGGMMGPSAHGASVSFPRIEKGEMIGE